MDGTVRFVYRQARWLNEHGFRTAVFGGDGVLRAEFERAKIPFTVVPALSADVPQEASMRDRDTLIAAASGFDAIVATASRPFPFVFEALGRRSAIIYDVLSCDLFASGENALESVRWAAERGHIIAHSKIDACAHLARFGGDPHSVRIAYLPIDEPPQVDADERQALRADLGIAADDKLVLTATRLDDDHVRFVLPLARAVDRLRSGGRSVRLVVVGDGACRADVERDAPPLTRFTGTRFDLDRLYAACDLYCGEGTTRLEAAARAIPVIATGGQTHADASLACMLWGMHSTPDTDERSNTIVPQISFDEAITLLLDDTALARRAAQRALLQTRSRHGIDSYMGFLTALIAGNAPAGPVEITNRRAARHLHIDGDAELPAAARTIAAGDGDIGVSSATPISWRAFGALADEEWPIVAGASHLG
jgi:hypothetical protein